AIDEVVDRAGVVGGGNRGGGGGRARVLALPGGHAGGGSPGGDGPAPVEVPVGRRVRVGYAGVADGDGLRRPARLRRGGGRLRRSARGQQGQGGCGATGGPPPGTVRQAQCSFPSSSRERLAAALRSTTGRNGCGSEPMPSDRNGGPL